MGDDEYHPMSRKGTNLTKAGGIGYTVIDSIDTMLLMGLEDDYKRARSWVENKLSFEQDADFSTFEVCLPFVHITAHKLTSSRPRSEYSVVCFRPIIYPEKTNFSWKKP